MTTTFKPGDKIVVDADHTINKTVIHEGLRAAKKDGTVLTVQRVYNDFVNVEEFGGNFYQRRFKLAEVKKAKPKRDYVADHARRSLRTAGLTPEQAAKFVKNAQTMKPFDPAPDVAINKVTGHLDLSQLSRQTDPLKVAHIIGSAFRWGDAPEGIAYWNNAYSHLVRLGSPGQ